MSTRRRFKSGDVAVKTGAACQIIGLKMHRISGIMLSRNAYALPLREIFPNLIETTIAESEQCKSRINIWAVRAMSQSTLRELERRPGLNIWCLVLESTSLQPGVLEAAQKVDQIWVPTTFVRDVCVKGGVEASKLRVIPYFLPEPARPRRLPTATDPFTVLVSWDDASNMNRKNVVNSIRAFKRAWPQSNKVRLKLKTRDLKPENEASLTKAINGDSRILLDNSFAPSVDDVFDGAHVLLHLHRAEGYGRHIIEAMQRDLPVISTAYSGCMDWLTPANALLVDYELIPTGEQEFQYPIGGRWAEPDIDQAVKHLRWCRNHYATEIPAMVHQARQDAQDTTSFSLAKKAMVNALKHQS